MSDTFLESMYNMPISYVMKGPIFECTKNLKDELDTHSFLVDEIQTNVDRVRNIKGEEAAEEFYKGTLENSDLGRAYLDSIDCLEKLNYNVQDLPVVDVPEFGLVAKLILPAGIAGATLGPKYGKQAAEYVKNKTLDASKKVKGYLGK